ncbi:hypothetical protein JHL22_04920 [Advenella sp. WQ 585]|uniref:Sulfatase-modifying factor enzyme domain-containing protein n=1 Tax=Advenella mandrilli TaxID=2800330 RepID=A0ABS1EF15_9BURK|nr:hypothetical protein [Advenella mandrilli]MBK1780552.1 hypothetical protein [Advenella mandrilli]
MTLKTVTVTGQIYNPDGTPAAGVEGYATLNRPETDNGIVIPTSTFIKADADGKFSIQLWPNARGSGQSQYIVRAYTRRASVLNLVIVVPDVDVPVVITDIAIAQPYPPIDQSLQALLDVQAASVIAQAAKVDAESSADAAFASEEAAALSESNAGQSAQTAGTKAQEAGASAQSALESKNAAALSEQNAGEAKDDAVVAKDKAEAWADNPVDAEVEAGRYSAKHHAIKADQSALSAAQSKADSETAKGIAEEKALAASGSATAAGQSASNAAGSALSANEDRAAAQQSAGQADGSADDAAASKTKAQQWASNPENAPVEGGLYSALHYANKASASATTAGQKADAAALSESNANDSKLAAKQSEDNAKASEENAAISLQTAQEIAIGLSAYAIPGQVVKTTPGGQVTYLFRQPAYNLEDVAPGGELGTGLHPAFLFNGTPAREIFIGAYPGAMVNGEIVCQPGRDPRVSRTFDQSRAECQALGAGWDIMSNWDWSAIALWCMANGFQPRGNTNYGRSHANRWETGTRVVDAVPGSSTNTNGRTLTGSGPATWSHNNTPSGIHDLAGNVGEFNSGLILDNNIFKIAPDNGIYLESEFIDTAYAAAENGTFSTRPYTDPPLILKRGLVVPASASLAPVGYFYKNAEGLRFASRGGSFFSGPFGGAGAMDFRDSRANAGTGIGFRPRFRVI